MRKLIAQILFLLLFTPILCKQDKQHRLKFDLSVRYRFGLWNGMNAKNFGDDSSAAIGSLKDKILMHRIMVYTIIFFILAIASFLFAMLGPGGGMGYVPVLNWAGFDMVSVAILLDIL